MEKAVDEVISRLAEIEDTANRMNEAVEVRNAGLMNCSRSLKKKKKKRSPA